MPIVDVKRFRSAAQSLNKRLGGTFAKSSLDPILDELGTAEKVSCDELKTNRLREMIFDIPYDKQIKYTAALAVLEQAGFVIGARPTSPSVQFSDFGMCPTEYMGLRKLRDRTMREKVKLDTGSLHLVFWFKFKSSNGNIESLKNVWVREEVRFLQAPSSPPFTDAMGNTMHFTMGEGKDNHFGMCKDDHSIKALKLACRWPLQAGQVVAQQWYQYSHDFKPGQGGIWHNIPGAAFLLTKGVRKSRGEWVYFFHKKNWAPHNQKSYHFEAEFPIGDAPELAPLPGQNFMKTSFKKDELTKYGRRIRLS